RLASCPSDRSRSASARHDASARDSSATAPSSPGGGGGGAGGVGGAGGGSVGRTAGSSTVQPAAPPATTAPPASHRSTVRREVGRASTPRTYVTRARARYADPAYPIRAAPAGPRRPCGGECPTTGKLPPRGRRRTTPGPTRRTREPDNKRTRQQENPTIG